MSRACSVRDTHVETSGKIGGPALGRRARKEEQIHAFICMWHAMPSDGASFSRPHPPSPFRTRPPPPSCIVVIVGRIGRVRSSKSYLVL